MSERGEAYKHISVEFRWQHPNNGCFMIQFKPVITRSITGIGMNESEAQKNARIIAENSPEICEGCRTNYQLQ